MTDAIDITFLPGRRTSRVPAGTSLFIAAHWIGLPIESACGGRGTCGKCRVLLQPGGETVSSLDRAHLSASDLSEGWRLACQAVVDRDTVCEVPRVQEMPRTATVGEGRAVLVEPDVQKIYLELSHPSAEDTTGDAERLKAALAIEGLDPRCALPVLRELAEPLRRGAFRVTAVIGGERLLAVEPGDTRARLFGVAFDIGTTTVVGSLVDLRTGEVMAVEAALNRQTAFGGDVISRIAYTMPGPRRRRAMRQAAVDTLNHILARLYGASGVSPQEVYQAVAVGNSTMLHLLLGVDARQISLAPFVPVFQAGLDLSASEVGLDLHPRARVQTLPLIGAYVGADTVAGLHATGIARRPGLTLFIDIGTNSEIALGCSERLVATSAPAGPAFEGSCIGSGMAATRGAIERVGLGDRIELEVLGGGTARGICGSGLIDIIAQLRRAGLLDASGRLRGRSEVAEHPLAESLVEDHGERAFALTDSVRLTQRDIRELQSAKSSIATGVRVLMERLGAETADLEAVLLAGSFGSAIDPVSARDIGLVPPVSEQRIHFVGNVASEGAKMTLLSFRERQVAHDLARRVEYVELSSRSDFNDLFIAGLRLPRVPMEAAGR